MLHSAIRALAFGFGLLLFLAGAAVISSRTPDAPGGVWPILFGAGIMVAVALERARYRSEAAERARDDAGPGGGETGYLEPRFVATPELFVDPADRRIMRVWVDPRTGERRYRAE